MKRLLFVLLSLFCITLAHAQTDTLIYHGGRYPLKEGETFSPELLSDSLHVDVSPQFPGGSREYYHFLVANIHYPNSAKEKGVQGEVTIRVVVEPNGALSSVSVASEPKGGEVLGKEAMRVVMLMPKFKPGMKGGKAVRTELFLVVKFVLL
jgi:TonB family protein